MLRRTLTTPAASQTFLTLLSLATAPILESLLSTHILKGLRLAEVCRAPPEPPGQPGQHMLFEQYWVETGAAPLPDPEAPDEFVLTPSVRRHLSTLARAVLLRKHPILLQVWQPQPPCTPRACDDAKTFLELMIPLPSSDGSFLKTNNYP